VSCAFLLNDWKGLSAIPILCGYFITNCAEAHPLSGQAGFATSAFGWHKRAVRILYHLPLSPYARKVRLALAEKRIPFDLRVERVWERRQEFLEINPAGTVPVLQEENGFCIIDSYAICEYLDEAYPDMPLLGRSLRGNPDAGAIRAGYANLRPHLDYLGWLAETRPWLGGNSLSLADLAAAAHLSALDYLGDVDWGLNDAAKDWYARVKSRPSFRPLLQDRISGLIPPEHYTDLDF